MSFTEAVQSCFSKFVTFSGRAQRSEYWYFVLFSILGSILISIIGGTIFGWSDDHQDPLSSIFSLVILLPSISVSVRRLHDLDRSGWWWWLWCLPLIGWIIMIIWYATRGSEGDNRFGSDPLGGHSNWGDASDNHRSSIPSVPRKD